jgi:hypothetical protein
MWERISAGWPPPWSIVIGSLLSPNDVMHMVTIHTSVDAWGAAPVVRLGLIWWVWSSLVLGCGTVAKVVEGELVGGRLLDGDAAVHLEVTVGVEQFTRVQRAPSGVFVHAFAGYHHRGSDRELTGADADSAGGAGLIKVAVSVRAASAAAQHEQVVGVGIAQRETARWV